jgi:hypothetical protein
MKKITLLAFWFFAAALVSGAEFKITNADVRELAAALQGLDGYDRDVDRGPGNGHAVIRANYSFTPEVRSKLAANLTVLQPVAKAIEERLAAKRIETVLALGVTRLDPQNEIHVYEVTRRVKPVLAETVTLDLSPVTVDDLKGPGGRQPDSDLYRLHSQPAARAAAREIIFHP